METESLNDVQKNSVRTPEAARILRSMEGSVSDHSEFYDRMLETAENVLDTIDTIFALTLREGLDRMFLRAGKDRLSLDVDVPLCGELRQTAMHADAILRKKNPVYEGRWFYAVHVRLVNSVRGTENIPCDYEVRLGDLYPDDMMEVAKHISVRNFFPDDKEGQKS